MVVYFNASTGEEVNSKAITLTHLNCRGMWLAKLDAGMCRNGEWEPRFDWCGRYIGAVLGGEFEDVENMKKRWG